MCCRCCKKRGVSRWLLVALKNPLPCYVISAKYPEASFTAVQRRKTGVRAPAVTVTATPVCRAPPAVMLGRRQRGVRPYPQGVTPPSRGKTPALPKAAKGVINFFPPQRRASFWVVLYLVSAGLHVFGMDTMDAFRQLRDGRGPPRAERRVGTDFP